MTKQSRKALSAVLKALADLPAAERRRVTDAAVAFLDDGGTRQPMTVTRHDFLSGGLGGMAAPSVSLTTSGKPFRATVGGQEKTCRLHSICGPLLLVIPDGLGYPQPVRLEDVCEADREEVSKVWEADPRSKEELLFNPAGPVPAQEKA